MQMRPAGESTFGPKPPRLVKQFENTPLTQSIVDQIIFNRDMDFSGDDQFDNSFTNLYTGSAGKASWQPPTAGKAVWDSAFVPGMPTVTAERRERGRRTYKNNPTQQSMVDQTVFGRDMDDSGDTAFDASFMKMYHNSAGCPSWVAHCRGLGHPVPVEEVPLQKQPLEVFQAKQRRQRRRRLRQAPPELPPLPDGLPKQLQALECAAAAAAAQGSRKGHEAGPAAKPVQGGSSLRVTEVAQQVSGKVAQQVNSMAALVDKWRSRKLESNDRASWK